MSTFMTSDLHFHHINLAREVREYTDIDEHDEMIIRNWNKVVNKRDKVYVAGDITMENHKYYHLLARLNGFITVVGGNHDLEKDTRYLLEYVDRIVGCVDYKGFCITHIPIHPRELDGYYRGNIHGHMHKERIMINGEVDKRYINVCMDLNGYTPINFEDILKNREDGSKL